MKSTAYKNWIAEATWQLSMQRLPPTILEDVAVVITVHRPDRRRRDIDNLLKATLDLISEGSNGGCRIIKDDSQIVDLRIKWGGEADVAVEIYEA